MKSNTANREMRITKVLNAPIALVWEVWTQPEHIKHWYGPTGFTNTIDVMDFKEEGEWKFTMHGPDGVDYANRNVFKEIIHHQKIVFEHGPEPHFITTVLFESLGDKTEIHWTVLLDTEEIMKALIEAVNAKEAHKQNIVKLENYLNTLK